MLVQKLLVILNYLLINITKKLSKLMDKKDFFSPEDVMILMMTPPDVAKIP